MARISSELGPSLHEKAIASSSTHGKTPPIQKVVPLSLEEAVVEVQVNFAAPEAFKIGLDQYIANHVTELKPMDMHTRKAFCVKVLQKYMDEHP